ncbi:MAG TPA: patatin-like phospholipase family protein [Solirubrobacteraceae bacterium]|nr:patatin-like phospholipase family protein [Solirubrobacteraceae bacterium]
MPNRPDVLVLGGGGVLGEAWMMGVLSGYEDATGVDLRRCEYFVGTSAGSMVAAHLVAGRSPRRPKEVPDGRRPASAEAQRRLGGAGVRAARRSGDWALATAATFAPLALGLLTPGGALVRAAMLRRLPRPTETLEGLRRHIESLGARFDGRLRVAAVDRDSGRRTVFGSPRAPGASVAEAVEASCTVPWLFAPVAINGREYVDGGVWSPTNLDAAPAGRGSHVLCLNPTASLMGRADVIGVFRRVSRVAAGAEALALRRRGATVRVVGPDRGSAQTMGVNLMDRSRAQKTLSAGYQQGLELG